MIRGLHSPDADLRAFDPPDPDDFGILVQVMVGPSDGPGEESFDLMVCTPRWISREISRIDPMLGRHHLLINDYNFIEIDAFLRRVIETQIAPTWEARATRVGRIGHWEFEDYQA